MTRFRDGKVCNNLATDEIDDHRIQSDYKYKSERQIQKERVYTWYCVCVVTMHDDTSDTNDNVTTEAQSTLYTAHMNIDM